MDDLKISHIDSKVVDNIIHMLNKRYGKNSSTVTRGKLHDYLGMTLDFSNKRLAVINMTDYVESVLEEAPTDINGESTTSTTKHLFEINDKPVASDEETADLFHSMTAKLQFLAKRGRPDVQNCFLDYKGEVPQ